MAIFVLKDALFSIDAVDLSEYVRTLTLNYARELLDATAMGVNSTRDRVAGLLDWSVDIEFNQDFAAAKVDATLFPFMTDDVSKAVIIRPVKDDPIGATNPEFQGNAFLENYPPIAGGVAAVATVTATFQGDGLLTRATS